MKSTILIRCDGNSAIGMGHVVRCTALAQMLKNDFKIKFAIQKTDDRVINLVNETGCEIIILPQTQNYDEDVNHLLAQVISEDIIVLDGYYFSEAYQRKIKANGNKLVFIDDLIAWHQVADIVINQALNLSPSLYSSEIYTQILLGLDYSLLRAPFLKTASARNFTKIEKVFISMGAADVNNITQKFVEALISIKQIKEIHLMLGAVNPHLESIDSVIKNNPSINIQKHFNISASELYQLLHHCDLCICPASSIMIEACAVGIPLVSGFTADNQKDNLQGMDSQDVIINLGDLNSISKSEITEELFVIIQKTEFLTQLVINQKKLLDGKSAERLLTAFKDLAQDSLTFRLAQQEDSELYFNWANENLVRQFSFNQDKISFADHHQWFQNKLKSPNCYFYLFFDDKTQKPAGQVRIDKSGEELVIGISIDKDFRGNGLGREMLRKATIAYHQAFPNVTIVAYIKIENQASYQLFKKAGFEKEERSIYNGCEVYKLYKKRDERY